MKTNEIHFHYVHANKQHLEVGAIVTVVDGDTVGFRRYTKDLLSGSTEIGDLHCTDRVHFDSVIAIREHHMSARFKKDCNIPALFGFSRIDKRTIRSINH